MTDNERFLPLVGTLGYIWDSSSDHVLMVRRNKRSDDDHLGKVNGLGGKVERNESITAGMKRELKEEADIDVTDMALRGTVTWSNFGPRREDWLGFMFLVTAWTGEPPSSNDEGDLEWIPRTRLLAACAGQADALAALPMWPGDHLFVPFIFDERPEQFHGTMPYDGEHHTGWTVEWI